MDWWEGNEDQQRRIVEGVHQGNLAGKFPSSPKAVTLDEDLDPETLQVDDGGEDDDGRDEVHNVRETFPPKRFMECTSRIAPNEDEIEQSKDSTLEFGSTSNVDSRR
jgi:hypothetical protein